MPVRAALSLLLILFLPTSAGATEVAVFALMEGRATLSVDGSPPKTLRAGETFRGVKLIGANTQRAIVEIDGRRETLGFGEAIATGYRPTSDSSVTLVSNHQGHFLTTGTINGATVRFLVDTGATMVSMDAEAARRAGINYLEGEPGQSMTANGIVPVFRVRLDDVRVGDIVLRNVEGLVHEGTQLPVVLLGMSFLSRMEMRREGSTMTLIQRY